MNAELLEFVIKRRSANHSWRPSSKAAPKKSISFYNLCLVFNRINPELNFSKKTIIWHSQHYLASNVLVGRASEEAFYEFLRVSNVVVHLGLLIILISMIKLQHLID